VLVFSHVFRVPVYLSIKFNSSLLKYYTSLMKLSRLLSATAIIPRLPMLVFLQVVHISYVDSENNRQSLYPSSSSQAQTWND